MLNGCYEENSFRPHTLLAPFTTATYRSFYIAQEFSKTGQLFTRAENRVIQWQAAAPGRRRGGRIRVVIFHKLISLLILQPQDENENPCPFQWPSRMGRQTDAPETSQRRDREIGQKSRRILKFTAKIIKEHCQRGWTTTGEGWEPRKQRKRRDWTWTMRRILLFLWTNPWCRWMVVE